MTFQNILKLLLVVIIALTIGGGLGYYYAPDKIKIEERVVEKIVEKEKEIDLTTKEVIERYDPVTGKLIERIIRDKVKKTKSKTDKTTTEKEKITEKIKSKKLWAAKAGAVADFRNDLKLTPRVGGEMRLPIFNLWVGTEFDISIERPTGGLYLRTEF